MMKDPNRGVKLYIEMLRGRIRLKTTSSKYRAIYTNKIKDIYTRSNMVFPEWLNEL